MTYSVVAHCRRTGEFGVGIATYSPNVGVRCPVVVPGRGAASLQAVANPLLLDETARLIGQRYSAEKVLKELRDADPYPEYRQMSVVDVHGRAFAVTGKQNVPWAGHEIGDGWVCAGNVMVGPEVVAAMAQVMATTADLPLAERLMRTVEAGRDAGGQPEGQNSAALRVCDHRPFPLVDLRVDLHDAPEQELRRLWDWWAPMVPYYAERAMVPSVARWWQWRQDHVPGWIARHLRA